MGVFIGRSTGGTTDEIKEASATPSNLFQLMGMGN